MLINNFNRKCSKNIPWRYSERRLLFITQTRRKDERSIIKGIYSRVFIVGTLLIHREITKIQNKHLLRIEWLFLSYMEGRKTSIIITHFHFAIFLLYISWEYFRALYWNRHRQLPFLSNSYLICICICIIHKTIVLIVLRQATAQKF